jgi:hypothetical protein
MGSSQVLIARAVSIALWVSTVMGVSALHVMLARSRRATKAHAKAVCLLVTASIHLVESIHASTAILAASLRLIDLGVTAALRLVLACTLLLVRFAYLVVQGRNLVRAEISAPTALLEQLAQASSAFRVVLELLFQATEVGATHVACRILRQPSSIAPMVCHAVSAGRTLCLWVSSIDPTASVT